MIRRNIMGVHFSIGIAVVFAIALQICPVVRSQDPPPQQTNPPQTTAPQSLGDIARKNREDKAAKDKGQTTPAKSFTNDDVISGKGGALLGPGVASGAGGNGTGSEFSDTLAKMDGASERLDALGALDHATLFKNATQGITVDFPGRKEWENRLVAARQNYVVHGKELIQATRAVMIQAKTLHDAQPNLSDDDPRVKSFMATLQTKMSEAQKLAADFKAIVDEGHDRAAQAAGQ